MGKPAILFAAGICGGLGMLLHCYYHVTPYNWRMATAWTLLLFVLFQLIWSLYLYPFYLSPYLWLPHPAQQDRNLKSFLTPVDGNEALDWFDSIPNEGFIRYVGHFNKEFITITDPKAIADMIGVAKYDHWIKEPALARILEESLGYGLVTSEGANHKHQRKHLLPTFNTKVIKELYPLFWDKSCEMISAIKRDLKTNYPSTTISINSYSGRAALDIIGQAGFGADFGCIANPNTPLNKAYHTAFTPSASSKLFFLLSILTHPKFVKYLPIEKSRLMRHGIDAITDFVTAGIEKRQKEMLMNSDDKAWFERNGQRDIIAKAMQSGVFDKEGLVNQSKTLLGAGHETSATGLTWAIYLLAQPSNAHIQTKLRSEIRSLLPSPSSGIEVTSNMLDKLPYLDAVSKEVLRIRSPIPRIARVAIRDTTILDLQIKKGTSVLLHSWAINRAKHLWGEDGRVFKPERWLGGGDAGRSEGLSYLTFGHGPRGCIGRGFAIAENKALLAALVGSFELKSLVDEAVEPEILWGITAKLMDGLSVETKVVEGW